MKLTKEQQEQFAQLLGIWQKDIAKFAIDVFGSELRAKQIEFCEAYQTSKRVTFKGGVGFGKTHVLAIITWWSLVCFDKVKVTIFGPNEAQLKSGVWNEILSLYGRIDETRLKPIKELYDVTATRVSRKTRSADCYAEFRLASKDNIAGARGIHADNNFILVDEATGVPDEVFEGALQNHLTTDLNPKLVLISNPKATSGYFWNTWNDPDLSEMWTKVHGRMADNPRVTEEDLRIAAKQYGGKGSNDYIIHVEGDFPTDSDDGLISSELVNQAIDNEDAIPSDSRPIIWGVDPAGPGKDRTVILKRHDNRVLPDIIEQRGMTITQLTYLVRDMYQRLPASERARTIIAVDANGLGRGLADNLADFGLPVRAITTQSSPTKGIDANGNSKFAKLRDQLWWSVKEWFETEAVSIPNNYGLIKEVKAPSYGYDASGKVKIEGKIELRKRLKASTDYADALCLTFAVDEKRYFGKYNWSKPVGPTDLRWAE